MKQKNTTAGLIFDIFNVIFMFALMVISVYPLYYVIMASFSDPNELMKQLGILLRPAGFSTAGYEAVLKNEDIYIGYGNTLFYVAAAMIMAFVASTLLAYSLSRRTAKYGKYISIYMTITMFFSGGMIPLYLVVKMCGLLNTRWAVLLPGLISVYNTIVLRTAFSSVPESLIEAAKIDGASEFRIYARIVLPLSGATIAVFFLFTGVQYWNSWFNAMIYLQDRSKFPLQLFLREILVANNSDTMTQGAGTSSRAALKEIIKYSTIVVSTLPILAIYPFVQKYFVNGVMIGAVKG